MRLLSVFVLFVSTVFLASLAQAKTSQSIPPGGAAVFGPFSLNGATAEITGFEQPSQGEAYLADGATRLVYKAPDVMEEITSVTLSVKLFGDTSPRSFSLDIDPDYSARGESAVTTALEWLLTLLILALFIEAAVLFLVAFVRNFIRLFGSKSALDTDGFKPSVYKPIFAFAISLIAVLGFGLSPLTDIVEASGSIPSFDFGSTVEIFADGIITVLLLAGGAESVRRVATGVMTGLKVPTAERTDQLAEAADTRT